MLFSRRKKIILCLVLSHIGIAGNESADTTIKRKLKNKWLNVWQNNIGNNLRNTMTLSDSKDA